MTLLLTAASRMPDGRTVTHTLSAAGRAGYVVTHDDAGDVTTVRRSDLPDAVAAWGGSFLTGEQVTGYVQRLTAWLAGHPSASAPLLVSA